MSMTAEEIQRMDQISKKLSAPKVGSSAVGAHQNFIMGLTIV